MKAAKIIIAASLFAITASFSYAGPGAQYWTEKRATRARAAAVSPASETAKPEACCKVTTVQRPVASHKVTLSVKKVECSGCAAMAAGEKCPTS